MVTSKDVYSTGLYKIFDDTFNKGERDEDYSQRIIDLSNNEDLSDTEIKEGVDKIYDEIQRDTLIAIGEKAYKDLESSLASDRSESIEPFLKGFLRAMKNDHYSYIDDKELADLLLTIKASARSR